MIEGLDAVLAHMDSAVAGVLDRASPVHEAESILSLAQSAAPVKTGELRDSGAVIVDPTDPLSVAVVFTAPHAAIVHENVKVLHPHGTAKFLEKAAEMLAGWVPKSIADRANVGG